MLKSGLFLSCLFAISVASASNFNFLRDTNFAKLSPAELEQLKLAIDTVLTEQPDQESRTWLLQENGQSVKLTPLNTYEKYQTSCRTLRIELLASPASGNNQFDFCRAEDNSWKVLH